MGYAKVSQTGERTFEAMTATQRGERTESSVGDDRGAGQQC